MHDLTQACLHVHGDLGEPFELDPLRMVRWQAIRGSVDATDYGGQNSLDSVVQVSANPGPLGVLRVERCFVALPGQAESGQGCQRHRCDRLDQGALIREFSVMNDARDGVSAHG
jgi:hypothetical protein